MVSVEVTNLVADYGEKSLIRNLSFVINQPAFVAIIGHNGSGKTTLFKSLTQQIPYQGSIHINKQLLHPKQNPSVNGQVALLAQKNTVGFAISVKDLVVMGRFRHKRFFQAYAAADYAAVEDVLQMLQLKHLADKNFQELSGGEQQMVWLAQLMLQNTQICLLDEPTQQLDVYNKKRVFEWMMNWVDQHEKIVLCITHDLHYLFQMQGYLINLSAKNPSLELINKQSVEKNILFLENKENRLEPGFL